MLPCIPRKLWIALLILLAACAPRFLSGQTAAPVRYHFGDQPASGPHPSDPSFDDSAWPIAQPGHWPMPPFQSDGFVWVRVQVRVRSDAAGPLAIRMLNPSDMTPSEIFVNGALVGQTGSFPPHVQVDDFPRTTVFALPAGLTAPGETATVAFRVWYLPFSRTPGWFDGTTFEIDQSRTLRLATDARNIDVLLENVPGMAFNALVLLIAVTVLVLWRLSGQKELLLCGVLLLTYPLFNLFFDVVDVRFLRVPWRVYFPLEVLLQFPGMAITVEFIWTMNGLRGIGVKRLAQASMVVFNVSELIAYMASNPSPVVFWSLKAYIVALQTFNLVTIAANLWVILFRKQNRLIAASMALIPVASMLSGFRANVHYGYLDLFNIASLIAVIALSVMLMHRAWAAWRARDELRVEFEAAREVQEQLVAPAVNIPGFEIESVYAPAKQVGGDFFRVLPEGDGNLLVVVGDVSGKGLRAAMTVSSIIGALRTMPALPPARILAALNRGLVGQLRGGFVTCCVARIGQDCAVTIANAGHLSPYRNGAEVPVAAGLPLGIYAEAAYEESHFQLVPGETLTFLSDGVIEARNASGELFGFDRTLQISSSSAQAIAQAAIAFGQDDDITVLTLTRLPAGDPATVSQQGPALVLA
jgi:hypothetical protein